VVLRRLERVRGVRLQRNRDDVVEPECVEHRLDVRDRVIWTGWSWRPAVTSLVDREDRVIAAANLVAEFS